MADAAGKQIRLRRKLHEPEYDARRGEMIRRITSNIGGAGRRVRPWRTQAPSGRILQQESTQRIARHRDVVPTGEEIHIRMVKP